MVTSEHSQAMLFDPGSLGESASTSSLVGFHANRGLWPGSEWAKRMTVISGQRCAASLPKSDPLGYSLRMLLESSIWGSMTCYLTWRKSVTPRGRLLFRLVPSTPRTAGIGSGLWPTPDTPSGGRTMPEGTTPTGKTPDGWKVTVGLENAARMWPTITLNGNYNRVGASQTSGEGLATAVGVQPGLKLNSAWVSRMMGYPDGWLDSIPDGEVIR